jgi:hypothetical protein
MPAPGFALAWTAEAAVATWPLQMPHKQIKWANFLGWPISASGLPHQTRQALVLTMRWPALQPNA